MDQKQKHQTELWTALAVLAIVSAIVFHFFLNKKQKQTVLLPLNLVWQSAPGEQKSLEHQNYNIRVKKLKLPILMYHHIGSVPNPKDELRKDITVSPEDFEKQVKWLKDSGYKTVSLGDLFNYTKNKFKMPEKPIVLTFDDGYEDAFENAIPILKKNNFIGSFGVITQFPGIEYSGNVYANWATIRKAKAMGMEIVSHTQDHFDGTNPRYSQKFILKNLEDSQKDLQINLGFLPLPILIYPYGHYSGQYIQTARTAGFRLGLTTKFGKTVFFDKLMEIPRVRIHGKETLDTFKKLILE